MNYDQQDMLYEAYAIICDELKILDKQDDSCFDLSIKNRITALENVAGMLHNLAVEEME